MIMRANAQKMLPMLIPALVAGLSVSEDEDGDASGVAALVVVAAGDTVRDSLVKEDEGEEEGTEDKDKEVGVSDIKDEDDCAVGDVPVNDKDAIAVGIEAPPSWPGADTPQVCGETPSFDVIWNSGVSEESSPENPRSACDKFHHYSTRCTGMTEDSCHSLILGRGTLYGPSHFSA